VRLCTKVTKGPGSRACGEPTSAADLHEAKVTQGALSDEQLKSARNAHAIIWKPGDADTKDPIPETKT
jgi:hypothetical protein